MRILAYVNENRFWIDILKALEARGATIAYVFGPPPGLGTFHDDVRRSFPAVRYHDLYAANRAEYAEPDLARHALNFDAAAREVWENGGHQVLDLMSRLDMRDEMSYRDRRDLFRSHLRFADFIMRAYEIDGIVSSIFLHDPLLYVVGELSRRRQMKIATFRLTNFDGRLVPWWEKGAGPEGVELDSEYRRLLASGLPQSFLPDRLRQEIVRIRSDGPKAGATDFRYITNWIQTLEPRTVGKWAANLASLFLQDAAEFLGLKRSIKVPFPTRFEKEPGRTLAKSFRGPFARMRHTVWDEVNRRHIRRLRREYQRHVATPPANAPSVFVPLHYQPELTTMPLGGAFSDQLLLLETISAALPPGWQIIAKEHPAQHMPDYSFACAGRRPHDYELMSRIPGVCLVPSSTDQFELMQNCRAVATVTGTAGWEAALRGKPILVFGEAWYRPCRSVFTIRNADDCRRAFEAIDAGFIADPRDAEILAEAIEKVGVPPFIGTGGDWLPWVVDGRGDEQHNELVERYADHLALMLNPTGADSGPRTVSMMKPDRAQSIMTANGPG